MARNFRSLGLSLSTFKGDVKASAHLKRCCEVQMRSSNPLLYLHSFLVHASCSNCYKSFTSSLALASTYQTAMLPPDSFKNTDMIKPRLVLLSGLRTHLWIAGSPVRFLVRARAWVADQVTSRGHMRSNHILMFLSLSFSLPFPSV